MSSSEESKIRWINYFLDELFLKNHNINYNWENKEKKDELKKEV